MNELLVCAGAWYPGTVTQFDARSKKYTVEFEDGDSQETRIPDKDVEVVQDKRNGSRQKDGGAGKKQRTSSSGDASCACV